MLMRRAWFRFQRQRSVDGGQTGKAGAILISETAFDGPVRES
jgi:hypothetical protein